jgi:hypothetical protein
MFKTSKIKNHNRMKIKRIEDISLAECAAARPDERTMPYFEIVPEQVMANKQYLSLSTDQQGAFLRFIVHVVAFDQGRVVKHAGAISQRLGMDVDCWHELENIFIEKGLLAVSADGNYLIQHEFREQYLQTLKANNAKQRN